MAKMIAEPASITHHKVAMEAAAGPAGSSVDKGPAQPASIAAASAASAARWTGGSALARLRAGRNHRRAAGVGVREGDFR